jgi:hypothetical protein
MQIIQAHQHYKNGQLQQVSVLVQISPGDVRAIYATTQPTAGHMHLPPNASLTPQLLHQVATQGIEDSSKKYFR